MGKYRTRQELAHELGMNRQTFWRVLKNCSIVLPSGLLSPEVQEEVKQAIARVKSAKPF